LFAILAMTVFLFIPNFVSANVVINEICPTGCASMDHQWVEIFNPDAGAIDLTGWKFWENNTNHSLMTSTTDSILELGEYGVICQDDATSGLTFPSLSILVSPLDIESNTTGGRFSSV